MGWDSVEVIRFDHGPSRSNKRSRFESKLNVLIIGPRGFDSLTLNPSTCLLLLLEV